MKTKTKKRSPRNGQLVKGSVYQRKFDYKRDDTDTLIRKFFMKKGDYDKQAIFALIMKRIEKRTDKQVIIEKLLQELKKVA